MKGSMKKKTTTATKNNDVNFDMRVKKSDFMTKKKEFYKLE